MPILSPNEAYYLLRSNFKKVHNTNMFMNTFLPIASKNMYKEYKKIEIYNQFTHFLNTNFNQITISNDENYYQKIDELFQDQKKKEKEHLISIKNDINTFNILFNTYNYMWIISEISYAILCIKCNLDENEMMFIQTTSYILAASGYTLILCCSDYFSFFELFDSMFNSLLFSEYHIFATSIDQDKIDQLNLVNNAYLYIYWYKSYYRKNNLSQMQNPFVQIFTFTQSFEKVFNSKGNVPFKEIDKQIPICNMHHLNKIIVSLNNCQIFRSNDVKNDWTPEKIEFKKVFIDANDFLNWFGGRVQCSSELSGGTCEYIDFNEMHYLKIDHYIKDTLSLINIDESTAELINNITDNLEDSTKIIDRFKLMGKKTDKNVEVKMQYAFHKIFKHCESDKEKIRARKTQIYAVNHAINFLNEKVDDNIKGCIYQVHTGEGKSVIIQALAEIFAKMHKTVHIVTSNIGLACRDYEKSFNYFRECKFKSAVLLHKSELEKIPNDTKRLYYPESKKDDCYHESWFDDKSNMNIKVCKKKRLTKKCDIIFSTFFNFEAWYLRENEMHPVQMDSYFKDAYLIIDESDTILIDELTNGTILARDMKSNGISILKKVFDLYLTPEQKEIIKQKQVPPKQSIPNGTSEVDILNQKSEQILDQLKKMSSECSELTVSDVSSMLNDINTAISFKEGSRYILEYTSNIGHIVPFDSEHKGIAENEKEFSGFIHQFLGIKEQLINPDKNIEIKPFSLNYLFISHPIFVKNYQGVWGFTGTVGSDEDKETLQKYYNLKTIEIPDFTPNRRKDLPYVICSDSNDKFDKILEEVLFFHKKNNPVLVVFENLNDMDTFEKLLRQSFLGSPDSKKINENIFVFNVSKPDKTKLEKESGKPGHITLGSNFCGRGVDISYDDNCPLHVIISYGPQNVRAMHQAYGRTGRNGKAGTARIICTKDEYYKSTQNNNNEVVNNILNEYDLKKKRQSHFIQMFEEPRPWIFNIKKGDTKLKFDDYDIKNLRDIEINVNRLTAINYNFPICMSVDTFIKIQLQKIFSLRNCPECKYTRMLFQRYLRELILESWSLFLDKVTRDFELEKLKNQQNEIAYFNDYFNKPFADLAKKLDEYLPNEYTSINETFMRIHQKIANDWTNKIMNVFSGIYNFRKTTDSSAFLFFKTGFFPFEIKDKSGSRIYITDSNNSKRKINFISDPELLYLKKDRKTPFSITKIIDKIFEQICTTVDEKLKNFFGFHLFIRRTLSGCEFGICVDPLFDDIDTGEKHCLFDKSPIFLFTIGCKSAKPFIAAILIFLLVFVGIITAKIVKFLTVPGVPVIDILKPFGEKIWQFVKTKCKEAIGSIIADISPVQAIMNKIIKWLTKQILKQLHNYSKDPIAVVMKIILSMFDTNKPKNTGQKINDKMFSNIHINPNAKILFTKMTPIVQMIKIGILFILLLAAYIKNFKAKHALKYSKLYQSEAKDIFSASDNITSYESYREIKYKVNDEFSDSDDTEDNDE